MKKINVIIPPEPFGGKYDWIYRVQVNTAHCKVCGVNFNPRGHWDAERLKTVGICETCDFWIEKWHMRHQTNVARIDGNHYVLGNELTHELDPNESLADIVEAMQKEHPQKQGLGMSGSVAVIQFADGRVVFTNDLWHQGDIPERFQVLMPNNAVFVGRS